MTAGGSAVLRCVTVAADAPFPADAVKHKMLLVGQKSAQIKKLQKRKVFLSSQCT